MIKLLNVTKENWIKLETMKLLNVAKEIWIKIQTMKWIYDYLMERTYVRIQWRFIFPIVILCSRLRLWVGYFIYFKFTPAFFWWMFFNSVKEINRLRKEINRLISKEMSDIYLWRDLLKTFLGLKKFSPFQFWGTPTHADIIEH